MIAAGAAFVHAQKTITLPPGPGGSARVRTEWVVDGAHISIEYGRPALKGRSLKSFEWYGQEWRTGADQATTLKTDTRLKFGSLLVPAGTYTLYTLTGDKPWQLIVSKATGQWGIPYPGASQDLGRAPMRMSATKTPAELLTISIDDTPAGGTLRLAWGTLRAAIAFVAG
jgi:hypothetical protein